MSLKLPQDIIDSAGVCQNCFIKFNEIDEHQVIAQNIQNELIGLFNSCSTTISVLKDEDHGDLGHSIIEQIIDESSMTEMDYVADEEVVITQEIEEYPIIEVKPEIKNITPKRNYHRKKDPDEGLILVEIDGNKLYQCDICQKVCKDRYKLKNHKETHQTERNVCCNECGAMFKTIGCLYSHRKLHKERLYHDWWVEEKDLGSLGESLNKFCEYFIIYLN